MAITTTTPSTDEILNLIRTNQKKFEQKGVSYYNKDNIENKEKKENRETDGVHLSLGRATPLEATPLNQGDTSLLDDASITERSSSSQEVAKPKSISVKQAETPPLIGMSNPAITPQEVDRCLLTFYDNGSDARMRYRLGITINPNASPGERWEFIANLNKDRRIFMRNIPEENKEFVVDFGNVLRADCKERYKNYPLIGKIHNNSKRSNSTNQKEDGCAAAVYWTGSEWLVTLMMWEYMIKDIPLTSACLTKKQIDQNTKAVSGIIYGPQSVSQAKWQERARPTFKSRKEK